MEVVHEAPNTSAESDRGTVQTDNDENVAETGEEDFSDEGDAKEEVAETFRFHVPLEDCIDFRVLTQTQVAYHQIIPITV